MTTTTTTSQIRQNFHDDSINGINKLINMYWHGNYSCMSLWQHFTRDDVALSNIACYFEKVGKIKCWKAKQLMCYMNTRGGRVTMNDIQAPKLDWSSALEAFESTLEFEKNVNKELLTLHSIALKNNDYQVGSLIG
uniref:Ferritin n=1 Tax=Acrobeloides nanus TaxID=290746 RepID=A0A914EJV7_9BILA